MTKPVITCFSDHKDNLDYLMRELHRYYGSEINQTIFQDEASFINSLKENKVLCKKTHLFVIDVYHKKSHYVQFINDIHQLCPTSLKLILAEHNQLVQIKKSAKNDGSILFLQKPWYSDDFNNALNIASKICENRFPEKDQNSTNINFNERVEERVQQRLQKLIDANIAKDSFLSIISHDLKSPFMALQGISEILLNEWKNLTEEDKLELIGDLHKTSVETFKLLETLLEWAKLQKEKLEVTVTEVKIHNLVNATLKVSEKSASVKGIKITNKIARDINVFTDENMIATVFRNLVSNAVKYTQPGGSIEITANETKDHCLFCVADNGSGIDKPHVLELFNRSKPKKLNGNVSAFQGLGLIICKDFVEKSGGQIWLETKKGQGSKFFFTIPCQPIILQ